MPVIPNTITSEDTINAIFEEYIEKYNGEFDQFEQTVGLFSPEVVNAGTAIYKYVVDGELTDAAIDPGTTVYQKTTDTDVVEGKTYYTKGSDGTYSAVVSPAKASLNTYYIAYSAPGSSAGKTYVEGDLIARSNFKVSRVPLGEVNFIPYALTVTAQAIQRGGIQNAVTKVVQKAYRQLRGDSVADLFGWLNAFTGATPAAPESGTWNLQQMLAHTDETLLNTMETANESDTDIIHFVNRSDAYGYLAEATITTQDLFGLTYLENFLGVNKVFLTNKVTQGTVVATPVSNIKIYGIDYGTLADTGLDYVTSDFGLIGLASKPDFDHAGISVYPVRSMTILPEKEQFVVRGAANPS